tara:strand:+ start:232 stop:729 length:498 start_codon:yes stop_codon:yes gene_type:complete
LSTLNRIKNHVQHFDYQFIHLWSVGFFLGYAPYAPGTWGSLWAIVLAGMMQPISMAYQLIIWCCLTLLSCWTADQTARHLGHKDPSCIVCDEVVGCWIPLMGVPFQWPWVMCAFVMFRYFDIAKPWPVRLADQRSEGWAIVLDDCIAGVYALLVCRMMLWISSGS